MLITQSVAANIVGWQNTQIFSRSFRYKYIDFSTADCLISIFRNNTGRPLAHFEVWPDLTASTEGFTIGSLSNEDGDADDDGKEQ